MPRFGATDLLLVLVFVALVLDSRRLHQLARRRREELYPAMPAGGHPDRVGLTLRDIQMRFHVDWEDGGRGWDGPEILPVDEPEEPESAGPQPGPAVLPVPWKPLLALPAAGATGDWLQPSSTTSSPTATRPPVTTAA